MKYDTTGIHCDRAATFHLKSLDYKFFPWKDITSELDKINQAAEVFQQFMFDTMDTPTKSAVKE